MKAMSRSTVLLFTIAALVAACGGGDDDDDHDDDPDAEACEHLIEGPETDVTATATSAGSPSIASDHTRYDVALAGTGGFVRFAADEEAEFIFFVNDPIDFTLSDAGGEITPEDSQSSSPDCEEVQGRYTYDLTVGTYHIELGPAVATTAVSIVVEEAAHDH